MSFDDPFFRTRHPHRNGFMKSLTDTYVPRNRPVADDQMFKRAMQYRQREKAHYAAIEKENADLRSEVTEIKKLWDTLSKQKADDERLAAGSRNHSAGGRMEPADELLAHAAVADRPGGGRSGADGGPRAEQVKGQPRVRQEPDGQLPGEVLPASEPHHVRRPTGQDSDEGPEPRSGAGEPTSGSDAGDPVRSDEEVVPAGGADVSGGEASVS